MATKEQINSNYIECNIKPSTPNNKYLGVFYGYVRLSRDEDNVKKDSINTQIDLIQDWAVINQVELKGIFIDDNFTGYKFDRPGFNLIKDKLENSEAYGIIAKDLSRIGRHNALTLLFLEWIISHEKRLIAINDSVDTKNDQNESIIGIKTWYNELYIKDISKKIRSAIKTKQRKDGLVIVPSFGYIKNPNENDKYKWIIDEEVEWIIKLIFDLYINGYGFRKIANHLNEKNVITPSLYKKQKFNRINAKTDVQYEHLWSEIGIKRIITNKCYIGTLVCGTTQRTMIKGGRRNTDPSEYCIHENFFPPIIDKDTFNLAQTILNKRNSNSVRAGNGKIYKYAGILKCGNCGKGFIKRNIGHNPDNPICYICSTYFRYGKNECETHQILETDIDKTILDQVDKLKETAKETLKMVDEKIKENLDKKHNYDSLKNKINIQLAECKDELKSYSQQLAKGLIDEDIFKDLVKDTKTTQLRLEEQLNEIDNLQEINNKSKKGILKTIEILENIIETGELTNIDVSLLINKIIVNRDKENPEKLWLEIEWEKPFNYCHEITPSCDDVISWLLKFNKYAIMIA
mgnify:CR=1 FL=1